MPTRYESFSEFVDIVTQIREGKLVLAFERFREYGVRCATEANDHGFSKVSDECRAQTANLGG